MSYTFVLFAIALTCVSAWIENKENYETAMYKKRKLTAVPRFSLNLDLPPEERWKHIASQDLFQSKKAAIKEYLKDKLPTGILPIAEIVLGGVEKYFGDELGGEMRGLAEAYGPPLKLGDIVAVNMIMQLESLGLNCSNWNVTGATVKNDPGCMAIDKTQKWCYCHDKKEEVTEPGACTSIVAENSNGIIYHGRNLDWNVPPVIRSVMVDIDYQRNNKTIFTGTTAVGFVGVINGAKKGGFSVSINARNKGGKVITNVLQMLLHKSITPSQHMRGALENANTFDEAIKYLSQGQNIDDNYYIVGGVRPGEGAVIARDRSKAHAVWYMNETKLPDEQSWYVLQTNYDYWNPVPTADDRRTPGIANMNKMGTEGIGAEGKDLFDKVMSVYPTKNHHTDYTIIMSAGESDYTYNSYIWED